MLNYNIMCIKEEFIDLFELYRMIGSNLPLEPKDLYESKQIELLIEPIKNVLNEFQYYLDSREDYKYEVNHYYIKNRFTDESIEILVYQYYINVNESDNHHSVYDFLKELSKNFYMNIV